ncbi:MAG: hypothetical protein E7302_12920 [Butyrivibrio sp.]|nr:hypothetical protein [Butyrivibrio sp.]
MRENNTFPFDVAAAFYVFDGDEKKKQTKNKSFSEWLKKEGFHEIHLPIEGNKIYASYYIDINTKQYTQACMDIKLSPVIGNQGIFIEDFKTIYAIFKRQNSLESDYYHDISRLKTFSEYQEDKHRRELVWEIRKRVYFDRHPSFEEWFDDVVDSVMEEDWYKENSSKADIYDALENPFINRDLRSDYDNKELPCEVAAKWWIITF